MAGLRTPLSTLHVRPHDRTRMTRGRCGSLLLHRNGLAPSALCRSPRAPDSGHPQNHESTDGADTCGHRSPPPRAAAWWGGSSICHMAGEPTGAVDEELGYWVHHPVLEPDDSDRLRRERQFD